MLKRISVILASALLFISLIAVPVDTYAYVSASGLYGYDVSISSFTASSDGVFFIQSFYQSTYDPSIIKSHELLDFSKFTSGTWQGKDVSELESQYLFNQEIITSSISSAYVPEGDYFVYSLLVCIPVKSGDKFDVSYARNASSCSFRSANFYYSFIPNSTGFRTVYRSSVNSEHSFEYTLRSSNQHIVSVFNPLKFSSLYSRSGYYNSSPYLTSDIVNLSLVKGYNFYFDYYTTPFTASKGTKISLDVISDISDCCFTVYEILTTESEEETTTEPSTDSGSGGSSGSSEQIEVSNNILTNIKNLLSAVSDLPQKIADSIGHFFTDLKNAIVSGLEILKDKLLEGIEYLFKPSDNNFEEIKDVVEEKFKFVYQILDLGKSIITADFLDVPPNNKITLYGKEIIFMDWTLYDDYKPLIDSIIIIVSYYFYIQRLIKRIPGIIGGFHT